MARYQLTREQLRFDLEKAYLDARRHKRNRPYQRCFEAMASSNLDDLCLELWTRTYTPRPATCFIITDPKKREVFAAEFRDRIVHHLYYNYVHEMLERTFIQDSYSCIKGRGTHYGISRLERHIRQESQNYTQPCWVLKLDIRGYFMHIDRQRLLRITLSELERMSTHRISKHSSERWHDRVDMDFVAYLSREIILLNPIDNCRVLGRPDDWADLPHDKSLFHSVSGQGLPIGNLTSQLFSNVYLNVFDQYMKRQLRCRHYGRYVDDAYVVSADREYLHRLVVSVRNFLSECLGLTLHEGKLRLCSVRQGVEFLGAYLKPRRRYVSNATLRRMKPKIRGLELVVNDGQLLSTLNSLLGVLGHYCTLRLQRSLFLSLGRPWQVGTFVRCRHGYLFVSSVAKRTPLFPLRRLL